MSFEQHLALPIEQRHFLTLELQKRNWHAIKSELQKRNAQWMLVCGGLVLKSSASLEKMPTDEEIKKIGYQQNKVPLVFVRNPLIEETDWSSLPNDDWYPTLIGRNVLLILALQVNLNGAKKSTCLSATD